MILEAIILAGGFGTRLKSVLPDLPKPLAPISNKPFLFYLIKHLKQQGIKTIHISTFYKHEKIEEEFANEEGIFFHKEPKPLGTGGAILYNLQFIKSKNILIINGDTFTNLKIEEMFNFHIKKESNFTICATSIKNTERFGKLKIAGDKITSFKSDSQNIEGFINSGTYIANTQILQHSLQKINKTSFSIEKDFFEGNIELFAFKTNGYFIDIGIPEDYQKAQTEIPEIFKRMDI